MKKMLGVISLVLVVAIIVAFISSEQTKKTLAAETKEEEQLINSKDAIKYLNEQGIIEGYEDGQLKPENQLTRAEFAAILNRTYPDIPVTEKKYNFLDLKEEHWAYNDIQKAANAGWLKGFENSTFRPDEKITYEQAVAVICRILGLFVDENQYPMSHISVAIDYSISDGVDALIGENINRGQVATLIVNALNHENGQIKESDRQSSKSMFYPVPSISPVGISGGGGGSAIANAGMSADNVTIEESFSVADTSFFEPEERFEYNTEEYSSDEENVFKNVTTSPLSTFSIDTDTASYSNMRRFILNGQSIREGSIRSEELINYFDYAPAEIEKGKPFGVKYTVGECPWNTEHNLAMITVSGEELKEPKPSNIVFLIDISGSMYSYNKLPLVKQSLGLLLEKLGENDKISVVTYASGTEVVLEPTPATEKEKIMNVIDNLNAGGGTWGESGINLAYEQAEKYKCDGNNRVILCTDGDFNVGISSESGLEALISEKRESGIFLSVLGFGMGNYKDNKMEVLADKGNGNYAYIDNLREAKKVLVDDMTKTIYTIAKDVKIQVEFNPEMVSQYRLIGYENRLLNNEDFDNDKKDAGELGAGASVTVLYEIIPSNGEVSSNLKYQKAETTGSDELMTVKIRYKMPEGTESILSEYPVSPEVTETPDDDFRFAAAVAELGMILNESEYKGASSYDSVLTLAKDSLGDDPYGIRCEFIQLVDLLRYKNR